MRRGQPCWMRPRIRRGGSAGCTHERRRVVLDCFLAEPISALSECIPLDGDQMTAAG